MNKITKKLKLMVITLPIIAVLALAGSLAPVDTASAAVDKGIRGYEDVKNPEQPDNLFGEGGVFKTIVNVLLYLIGAISVIMLVYGGILYTSSGGNQEMITKAKNTIMYAVVGIVVALLAYAVVNFVITSFAA